MRAFGVDLRTSVMLALFAVAGAIALVVTLSPPLATAVFALTLVVCMLATLRFGAPTGLVLAAAGTVVYGFSQIALTVVELDPQASLLDPGRLVHNPLLYRVETWSPAVVGAVLLFATVGLAEVMSRVLTQAADIRGRQQNLIRILAREDPETNLVSRQHGLQQAEQEVARARRYRRRLTLALVGIDPAPTIEIKSAEHSELLRHLGEVLKRGLRELDVVSRYGDWEILLVLPETPREGARNVVGRLCTEATQTLSRTTRAAIMVFPEDGPTLEQLETELEAALAVCRTAGLLQGDSGLLMAAGES